MLRIPNLRWRSTLRLKIFLPYLSYKSFFCLSLINWKTDLPMSFNGYYSCLFSRFTSINNDKFTTLLVHIGRMLLGIIFNHYIMTLKVRFTKRWEIFTCRPYLFLYKVHCKLLYLLMWTKKRNKWFLDISFVQPNTLEISYTP